MIEYDEAVARVNDALHKIRAAAIDGDDEVAHYNEDAIRHAVLEWIAERRDGGECAHLARMVLGSSEIDFSRWYA